MTPVRDCDYTGIFARLAWVFQSLPSIAREKGHNEIVWLVLGFFFSFIALIAIAGMPDLVTRKYLRRLAEALPPVETNQPAS
jgi:hypothetical protein